MEDKRFSLIFDRLVRQAIYDSLLTKKAGNKKGIFPAFVKIKAVDTKIIKLTIERNG